MFVSKLFLPLIEEEEEGVVVVVVVDPSASSPLFLLNVFRIY